MEALLNATAQHTNGSFRPVFQSYLDPLCKMFTQSPIPPASCAGVVLLADLHNIALRSVLTGTASFWDALVICPGLHKQQDAPDLSKGEYPACAAMTSGYVFRVENEALVCQLQRLGRSGHLTTLSVSGFDQNEAMFQRSLANPASICYNTAVFLTLTGVVTLAVLEEYAALLSLSLLVIVRLVNTIVLRERAKIRWKGALEPGVKGDLIILLSQDRWIRIRGLVDDIKAVTSGQWLRDMTVVESTLTGFSALMVYANVGFAINSSPRGNAVTLFLLFASSGLLGAANYLTKEFSMAGRRLRVEGPPKVYARRLDLANQLVEETGRVDWAIRLGMVQPKKADASDEMDRGPKTM